MVSLIIIVRRKCGHLMALCCPSLRYHTIFSSGSTSGDIYCGDLGEGAQDEINLIQKGHNYGWDIKEGAICNNHPGIDSNI